VHSASAVLSVDVVADAGTLRKENQRKALVAGSEAWKKKGSRSLISWHLVLGYWTLTPRSRAGRR
jgi:hypothetical protein